MNLRMIYRSFLLSVCVVYSVRIYAQKNTFQYETDLHEVTQDGFYKIALTPEITGRCYQATRHDLRVMHKGQQVPYLLDNGVTIPDRTVDLPVITAATDNNNQFFVVVENNRELLIDELLLEIERTDVVRSLTLSGSDDNKSWYAIREDFYWNHLPAERSGSVTFPAVHYRYLKLIFNGKGKLPVKVLKVLTRTNGSSVPSYMRLPAPAITQKNSAKQSDIKLKFDRKYPVSRLELTISGPRYFHRQATVGAPYISDAFVVLSSGAQTITLEAPPADEINVRIDNGDNPPVRIDSVRAFQDAQYLIVYLEKHQSYQLTFGDSLAKKPDYDLAFFKDSIGKQIPELGIGKIENVKAGTKLEQPKPKDNKWLLWPLLVMLLAGLSFVTFRMVKKIGTES